MHINSLAWADENQLKCEKVRFLSEMSDINSRWVIFNVWEWTFFKSVDFAVIWIIGFSIYCIKFVALIPKFPVRL